ncbi:hypothetical protein MSG28_008340 [Choristoneura fumiferana]|uniref:Uncharacterized protein n=1 Tax=Choristoneura fumiferana TaxID=7141 RepID=A0ACC0JB51_CHOFU|nr:hypothetical protein MSG28_008340 [Choristoneura fumiferana]
MDRVLFRTASPEGMSLRFSTGLLGNSNELEYAAQFHAPVCRCLQYCQHVEPTAASGVVGPCARSARIATTILLANPAVKQQCLHCCVSAWIARQPESLMSFRACIVKQTMVILERANVAPPDEFLHEVTDGVVARVRDLLLQVYRLGFELHKECYTFVHGTSRPAFKRQRPSSLQPMRPVVERRKRPETMLVHESVNPLVLRLKRVAATLCFGCGLGSLDIHKELHRFVNDRYGPVCPRRSIQGLPGRPWFIRSESVTEEDSGSADRVFVEIDGFAEAQNQVSIEQLLTGAAPPTPPARGPRRPRAPPAAADEEAWSAAVARAIVSFARCWMRFVMERCERGRGRRPRWASQGLEFLMLACDPYNTRHLTDEEFEELKHLMDGCISHVVGSRATAPRAAEPEPTTPRPRHRLHSRLSIAGGNIFLTNEGHCLKLGDFGCAVKIRSTTTAAGELQGYVGTQAYMAPEVFMKSSGHGRATDIWSLGCVVTEMASGKRPFSEYDSNYQIMFVVGMGGRPAVPESLSEEGRQFCLRCLTHDPDQRPKAQALSLHHFLMVKDDDCHDCKPGKFL